MLQGIRAASEHWLGKIVVTIIFSLLLVGMGHLRVEDLIRGGSSNARRDGGQHQDHRREGARDLPEPASAPAGPVQADAHARSGTLPRRGSSGHVAADHRGGARSEDSRAWLTVPDSAVRNAIRDEKSFQNAQGQFDPSFSTRPPAGWAERSRFVREQRSVIARLSWPRRSRAGCTCRRRCARRSTATHRAAGRRSSSCPRRCGPDPGATEEDLKTGTRPNKGQSRPRVPERHHPRRRSRAHRRPGGDLGGRKRARPTTSTRIATAAPEKRTIQQIVFPDAAAAAAARKEIEAGTKTSSRWPPTGH